MHTQSANRQDLTYGSKLPALAQRGIESLCNVKAVPLQFSASQGEDSSLGQTRTLKEDRDVLHFSSIHPVSKAVGKCSSLVIQSNP